MNHTPISHIRTIINRLARIDASQAWHEDLNPTQIAVLEYLSRANRFSRSPSHVASFLGSTRGTVSQTLKALVRKGYVAEHQSSIDKRSISFDVSKSGSALLKNKSTIEKSLSQLDSDKAIELEAVLRDILNTTLQARGDKPFGICRSCLHHQKKKSGRYCLLLDVELTNDEADQICHEQQAQN